MKPEIECGICTMHWTYGRIASYADREELPALAKRLLDVLLRDLKPSANLGGVCNSAAATS